MARLCTVLVAWAVLHAEAKRPNVLFILADDLGFNDVSFHGSPQIPTPNIDEIARTGITLNNYHVQPVCSPTRATILSGRHVSHTGVYMPFNKYSNLHLNLSYSLLPKFMSQLGYETHMVGKWHIGLNTLAALPTHRGFDSYLGYLGGAEDYFSHSRLGGYDLVDGTRTAFEYNGTYSTWLWAERVTKILSAPRSEKPFFVYLAFQNVHWPLQAPEEYMRRFDGKTGSSSQRHSVCAMASALDDAVGQVVHTLKDQGLYEDTLIIFASDNGGPTNLDEGTWSSNYPLRGGKNSLWEGGTRVAAAIRGPGIPKELVGTVSYHKVHATDWLPTLVRMAANDTAWLERNWPAGEPRLQLGDGIDVWDTFSEGIEVRKEVLLEAHAVDDPSQAHGNGLIVGDLKLLRFGVQAMNPKVEFGWVPPPGEDASKVKYQIGCKLEDQPGSLDYEECERDFCLFNITADPCEYHNLASQHPELVQRLAQRLAEYQKTAVPMISTKSCGCHPVIAKGAWRPCDAPDPEFSWAEHSFVV